LSARQSVESLTRTPKVRRRNSRLWGNVARALLEVGLQELPGAFVQLGLGAGAPLRGEGSTLARRGGVALDGGEAHAEGPATSTAGTPRSLASTIFFLRSSE
jgi:hypothetical protein